MITKYSQPLDTGNLVLREQNILQKSENVTGVSQQWVQVLFNIRKPGKHNAVSSLTHVKNYII